MMACAITMKYIQIEQTGERRPPPFRRSCHFVSVTDFHTLSKGEKVATAMNCNSKADRCQPVVLGFNYEAHNAPAYKINNPSKYIRQSVSIYQCFWPNSYCSAQKLLNLSFTSKFWHWFGDPGFLYDTNILAIVSEIRVWLAREGQRPDIKVLRQTLCGFNKLWWAR